MSTYLLSVKDRNGGYIHHTVHEDIYVYVKQLENYIKHPGKSGIKNLYPERFPEYSKEVN
jgi:hypothetical protein